MFWNPLALWFWVVILFAAGSTAARYNGLDCSNPVTDWQIVDCNANVPVEIVWRTVAAWLFLYVPVWAVARVVQRVKKGRMKQPTTDEAPPSE